MTDAILGSLGGALHVAHAVGGTTGALLAGAARAAFMGGLGVSFSVGAIVALGGILIVLAYLPKSAAEAPSDPDANDSDDAAVTLFCQRLFAVQVVFPRRSAAKATPGAFRRHTAVLHPTQGGDRRCPQSPRAASRPRQSDRSRQSRSSRASRVELLTRRFAG